MDTQLLLGSTFSYYGTRVTGKVQTLEQRFTPNRGRVQACMKHATSRAVPW